MWNLVVEAELKEKQGRAILRIRFYMYVII